MNVCIINSGFGLWDLQTRPSDSRREAKKRGIRGHGTFIFPGLRHCLQQREAQS